MSTDLRVAGETETTIDGEQFRRDGHRVEKWSVGWGILSLAMWAWFATGC
ncbi:hypothetical protein ACH4KU_13335 [Streptomyces althioticus]